MSGEGGESWQKGEDGDVEAKFSGLNVNAKPFVMNINAPEFVPSFGSPATTPTAPAGTPTEPSGSPKKSSEEKAADAPKPDTGAKDEASVVEQNQPSPNTPPPPPGEPADSWEDSAYAEGGGEPDDDIDLEDVEDEEEDEDEEDEGKGKPRKKKPPKDVSSAVKKEHVNVIFIGHVDAGKSTIGGQIMYLTGMVDKRTLEKYEREAKEKNRESWYLSWALDTNLEEREKGKTVEVGRAFFETEKKHFTILDAPGHKSFVPNMIGGASQADLAVLVISARKGEFETGFDRGGQTREHAMLAKTAGVRHLVVLVNKMDDPTVGWSEARFIECKEKLIPYLKKCGFNPKTDLVFMPCSGLMGTFLKDPPAEGTCSWYKGPCFIEYVDGLPPMTRNADGPFLLPVVDKYKDMGTIILGKVESGSCVKGQSLILMPNRTQVVVDQLVSDDDEVSRISVGENVKIKLKGIEEDDVSPGFVLCDASAPCTTGRVFDAQIVILEHKSIICAGYSAVCHIHSVAEEVTVKALICTIDKKTGEKSKTRPRFVKQDQIVIMRLEAAGVICLETFKDFPQLGRFVLRDEGRSVAIGKVLKVIE